MNTQRLVLLGAAVVLVGLGAFLLLDGSEPPPPSTTTPPPGPTKEAVAPPTPPSLPAEPTPTAPPPIAAQVADASAPLADAPRPPGGPMPELEPSPFDATDSKELQYAVQLVTGPGTGPEQWRNAAEVFQKCVDANPHNYLCKRGVYAAWERIDSDGGPATALNGEVTLDPNNLPIIRKDGLTAPTLRPAGH